MQQDVGLDVDFIDPDNLDTLVPTLNSEGITVAALEHEAGFADPYLVATGFAKKARSLGAEIRTNTPVTDIELSNGTVTAVKTGADRYDVDLVVNAAGPWADGVAEMVGVDLPLKLYEAKVVCLSSAEDFTDYPTVSDVDLGLYAKPELNGDFLSGGMEREGGHESISCRSELEGVTNDDLRMVGEMLEHRLPQYADAEIVDSWSEVITASPDWHQIIGTPSSVDNFYIVAGGSGHGFKEAPGFAESIAETILDRKPTLELTQYRPERFESGDVFTGGYGDGSRS
jgi:sarcosine oxidase subunit beta